VGADILTPGQRRAVEALASTWGHLYDIGSRDGRYYARRDDGTGEALDAGSAPALDAAIRADRAREARR